MCLSVTNIFDLVSHLQTYNFTVFYLSLQFYYILLYYIIENSIVFHYYKVTVTFLIFRN